MTAPVPTDSNALAPIRIDPPFDPANWEDLPEYPQDLGWWRPEGVRIELGSGEATAVDHDPRHAVSLSDGTIFAKRWWEDSGDHPPRSADDA